MVVAAVLWIGCAGMVITAALRCRRHPEAIRLGRMAVAVLYLVAGAAVNGLFLARGDDYAKFADGSYSSFVRHTWRSVVVPHHEVWIGLLIIFEVAVGLLALSGGKGTEVAYAAAIVFHLALLPFGWGFCLWSVPMTAALIALWHGERRAQVIRTSAPPPVAFQR